MGGEKLMGRPRRSVGAGSPPRGRGKVYLKLRPVFSGRITPAWAGKREWKQAHCCRGWDHPRVGGEKTPGRARTCSLRGSPPRGRGKAYFLLFRVRIRGITPAWAGKRARADGVYGSYEDHPRVGGEKLLHLFIQPNRPGSPPRGRGKGNKLSISQCTKWITPAWAGKSRPCGSDRTGKRDHPRVGGEKYGSGHRPPTPQGSPPRGRGKDSLILTTRKQDGITPAWAGKSFAQVFDLNQCRDHPRVGGEKVLQKPVSTG